MKPSTLEFARERARQEIEEEDYYAAKDAEKARLRRLRNQSWWQRLFPFVITITRRDS